MPDMAVTLLAISRSPTLILASCAGVGLLPWAPGTWGTLAGLPLSLAINRLALTEPVVAGGAVIGLTILAVLVADRAARLVGVKDPSIIVIDEIAGFTLANFQSGTPAVVITAFVLFRLFDIAKAFPGRKLEALPGGVGIVSDDILAGLYTLVIVNLLTRTGLL